MSKLAALGVTVKRQYVTVDGAEMTDLVVTLPKSTGVEATFSAEDFADKVFKVFKREIQVGDPIFDEAVHIKTDTTDQTEKLLQSSDMRAIIERVIVNGGAIEIDGNTVTMKVAGRQEKDDEVFELFVTTLLG
ncbi:MAG TPA: hypothetical protein VFV99_05630 [Kofleriaceae bacterium]|nr:hypothetical protein [Kofleriaceae bacterium]